MELMSFGVGLVKTHIKNVGEEPPQAELNFSMKWVGIIFKTSRNAKGKAGKKKTRKSKEGKKNQKLEAQVCYRIRRDQITNYWAGE